MSTQIFKHSVAQHSQVSDEQLLSRARSGDQGAFGELCLRYTGMLKQRILRIVRNREDAEDVLQETLMRAYRHLDTFRGTCSVSTWMMTIGINTSLMVLRKRRSMPEVISEQVFEDWQRFESPEFRDPGLNPEQRYIADQTIDKLRSIMRRLPAHMRTVIDLYCVHELRLKDAAAILGITEATAKSRVLRGRNRLRRSLSTRRIPDRATVRRREDHPPV
ncbi:RNA polymerase sigma factor [Edaphobacter bradus]|uniref:RNA polymerase sigma factor n=1 Tax=Edaphobacter bradus TaxID=2259016 RepID=UPI0021E0D47D|nr:sigma-70 family RNA polymerase sigma factor [Edaphobacter bradus]